MNYRFAILSILVLLFGTARVPRCHATSPVNPIHPLPVNEKSYSEMTPSERTAFLERIQRIAQANKKMMESMETRRLKAEIAAWEQANAEKNSTPWEWVIYGTMGILVSIPIIRATKKVFYQEREIHRAALEEMRYRRRLSRLLWKGVVFAAGGEDPAEDLIVAEKSLEHGDYFKAITSSSACIGLPAVSPQFMVRALYCRAQAYSAANAYDHAEQDYTALVAMEPDAMDTGLRANGYLLRGWNWNSMTPNKQTDPLLRSIEDFTMVIKMENVPKGQQATAFLSRGESWPYLSDLSITERARRAVRDFNAALETGELTDEELSRLYIGRARGYDYRTLFDEAISDFSTAMEMDIQSPEAIENLRYERGICHINAKQYTDAIEDFSTALKSDIWPPEDKATVHVDLAWACWNVDENANELAKRMHEALEHNPAEETAQLGLGMSLLLQGDAQAAQEVYRTFLASLPESDYAYWTWVAQEKLHKLWNKIPAKTRPTAEAIKASMNIKNP